MIRCRGFSWLLCVIDVASRFGWAIPLRSKSGSDVTEGLKKVFAQETCNMIFTDRGREFVNREVQQLFKALRVQHFIIDSIHKASICERWQHTLKTKLWRAMAAKGTQNNWLPLIDDIVKGYNAQVHSSTGFAPKDVNNENIAQVFANLYGKEKKGKNFAFAVGTLVHVAQDKRNIFVKGYTQQFGDRVYRIHSLVPGAPNKYRISELNSTEALPTLFYRSELTPAGDVYAIDKVLRSEIDKKGRRQYLVQFKGKDRRSYWVNSVGEQLGDDER
jgi:hypothetical protein